MDGRVCTDEEGCAGLGQVVELAAAEEVAEHEGEHQHGYLQQDPHPRRLLLVHRPAEPRHRALVRRRRVVRPRLHPHLPPPRGARPPPPSSPAPRPMRSSVLSRALRSPVIRASRVATPLLSSSCGLGRRSLLVLLRCCEDGRLRVGLPVDLTALRGRAVWSVRTSV